MHQKHYVALAEDDENLQHFMLIMTILFIFMGILGRNLFLPNQMVSINPQKTQDRVKITISHKHSESS
jgi:hypothetical protein